MKQSMVILSVVLLELMSALGCDKAPTSFAVTDPAAGENELPNTPDRTWTEIQGEIYGARSDERGPIGGAAGYKKIVTHGDYRVRTLDALRDALSKAKAGEVVFVEGDVELDCTSLVFAEELVLEVPKGVTLASDRGHTNSPGALLLSDAFRTAPLIRAAGPDVRISGLRIRGPDAKRRMDHHYRAFRHSKNKDAHEYYYRIPKSVGIRAEFPRLTVDNCEIWAWSLAAVNCNKGTGHHVHHNYMHHNQRHGSGYGVLVQKAEALIEDNLFDWERHHIAGSGMPGCSYEARNNIVLSHANSHLFDMHGMGDVTEAGDGGISGTRIHIHHNSFLATEFPAIIIRGKPTEEARIHHNWLMKYESKGGIHQLHETGNFKVYQNLYGPNRMISLAVEDMRFGKVGLGSTPITRDVTLKLQNPLSSPISFVVSWDLEGSSWKVKNPNRTLKTKPKEKVELVFTVTCFPDRIDPLPSVLVSARSGKQKLSFDPQPRLLVQTQRALPRLAGTDRLPDHGARERLDAANQVVIGRSTWQGPKDSSAEVLLGLDEKGLHIMVDVTDDHVVMRKPRFAQAEYDCVVLYLDVRAQNNRDGGYGRDDVYQIVVGAAAEKELPPVDYRRNRRLKSATISSHLTERGYQVSLLIPNSDLPERLKAAGQTIGFDVKIFDVDASGRGDHQLVLWGGSDSGHNTSNFGILEFGVVR